MVIAAPASKDTKVVCGITSACSVSLIIITPEAKIYGVVVLNLPSAHFTDANGCKALVAVCKI
jgi:hypothetical protein